MSRTLAAAFLFGLAVVLTPTATNGSRPKPPPGKPPTRYGSSYLCPLYYPVYAYALYAGRPLVYYPPFHPGMPAASVKPKRCYQSQRQAVRAGYRLAPPPGGDLLVDGIYLVPPEASFSGFCRAASARAHIPVPCPQLVPSVPYAVDECDLANCTTDGLVVLEGNVPAPSWYVGDGPGSMHLW